jgi:hypothetical protein
MAGCSSFNVNGTVRSRMQMLGVEIYVQVFEVFLFFYLFSPCSINFLYFKI